MMDNEVQPFVDKFKKGLVVALKSLKFVWLQKKLLFFPLLTVSLIMGTLGIYEVVYYQLYNKHISSFFPESKQAKKQPALNSEDQKKEDTMEFILFALIITFASIFFFAFSNVALSYATSQAFLAAPIKIGSSLVHSIKRFPTLLIWTVSAFIIHIVVSIFKGKDENKQPSFLSRFLGEAIELAWYMATFLVIPILAHENIGALKSIKKSAQLMKKTFGENLAGSLFLPHLSVLILLICAVLSCGVVLIVKHFEKIGETKLLFSVVLPSVGLLVIIAGILCTIVSAANTVFKTAAYHYAIGNPVGPFDGAEIKESFVPEKKK